MIKKPFDIGSPEIYFTCALGSPINEVKLEVVDTAGLARMQLFLVNARIIGVETGTVDPSDPEEGVTETIALSFSKVKWVYREQGVGEIKRGWDLVANQQW